MKGWMTPPIRCWMTGVIQTTTFRFLGDYTLYGEFLDGGDGYWYGFSNEGNSSGSAAMVWVKIKKEDYSMTEGGVDVFQCKADGCGEQG